VTRSNGAKSLKLNHSPLAGLAGEKNPSLLKDLVGGCKSHVTPSGVKCESEGRRKIFVRRGGSNIQTYHEEQGKFTSEERLVSEKKNGRVVKKKTWVLVPEKGKGGEKTRG